MEMVEIDNVLNEDTEKIIFNGLVNSYLFECLMRVWKIPIWKAQFMGLLGATY